MSQTPNFPPFLKSTLLAATLAGCSTLAAAQMVQPDYDEVQPDAVAGPQSGGRIGAAVVFGHQYMGSDETRTSLLPLLDYRWSNGWFAGISNGVGYDFSNAPGMRYGLRLTFDAGRKESRSAALAGMGDLKARPEIGAFFSSAVGDGFSVNSSLRYGSGPDRNGLLASIGAGYGMALAPAWHLRLGVGATLANAQYMQDHFGVSAAQSASSGYASYNAGAGVRDLRASAALAYEIQPGMSVTAQLSTSSLQGDAADSPIVRQKTSTTGLVGFSVRF